LGKRGVRILRAVREVIFMEDKSSKSAAEHHVHVHVHHHHGGAMPKEKKGEPKKKMEHKKAPEKK
jgi:hypothetical protein